MFVGAYWSERKESKEAAAERIAVFLQTIEQQSEIFANWFDKAKSRSKAKRSPLDLETASIALKLNENRRDQNQQPIPDLGFRFTAWNGKNVSFSVTMGAYNPHVNNSVVLDLHSTKELPAGSYQKLLESMVRVFDPEFAVVTSDEHLAQTGASRPWEAGWFTYTRGDEVRQHPFH